MKASNDPQTGDQRRLSLPPWPTVNFRRLIPWVLVIVIGVYSIAWLLTPRVGGGFSTFLILSLFGFAGMGAPTMFLGFIFRAFDSMRLPGTYLITLGAVLGVIGTFSFMLLFPGI